MALILPPGGSRLRAHFQHHDTAYAVFHSAVWEWDDLGIVMVTLILAHLIPGGVVWLVVNDTLCHERRRQGRLRRHLPRSGPLLQAAQDLPLRRQLGRPRHRRPWPLPPRSPLLLVGALAGLPQEGDRRLPQPPSTGHRAGAAAGRGPSRIGSSGWPATRPTSTRPLRGPAGEPPSDRPAALEGGVVRAARPRPRAQGGRPPKKGDGCRPPRR